MVSIKNKYDNKKSSISSKKVDMAKKVIENNSEDDINESDDDGAPEMVSKNDTPEPLISLYLFF